MTSLKQKIVVLAIAAAGLKLYENQTAPINDIPENYTGTTDLVCYGERYELSKDNEIVKGTREDVKLAALKLSFENGHVSQWSAAPATIATSADPAAENQLISQFQNICARSPARCTPTTDEKGNTELYRFNDRADATNMSGTGLISKDLRNFTGVSITQEIAYATAMTCKIS